RGGGRGRDVPLARARETRGQRAVGIRAGCAPRPLSAPERAGCAVPRGGAGGPPAHLPAALPGGPAHRPPPRSRLAADVAASPPDAAALLAASRDVRGGRPLRDPAGARAGSRARALGLLRLPRGAPGARGLGPPDRT